MKRPPMVMRVQIRGQERKWRLWLPLFLLVPLALLLLIILSPLILIVIIILRSRRRQMSPIVSASLGTLCSLRGIKVCFDLLCSMRGLRIDICNQKERVYVSVI